eukprot:CAMPEP_0115849042 /NCGR_PEP_ID=MMETSP0287-20121206/11243_1 /TAXON_ID=412157 /ORGANISM="Chrysochromulina rotalis, Strain UIO044" /LENGTH=335 /DNA_ID=CAMNT_0003302993 /DNA_START=131 /DNA_END=1135 /DNA_ORIENTATION=-
MLSWTSDASLIANIAIFCLAVYVALMSTAETSAETHLYNELQSPYFLSVDSPTRLLPSKACLREHASSAFCMEPIREFEDMEAFLDRECQWKPAGDALDFIWVWESPPDIDAPPGNPDHYSKLWCHHGDWFAYKLGPFQTSGDGVWGGIAAILNSSYLPYPFKDLHAVSNYMLASVDASGKLLGFPPLHQHHYHLGASGGIVHLGIHAHYESYCREEYGGQKCLYHAAPAGYAFMLRERIVMYDEFRDERPPNSHSLTSWVIAMVKWADQKHVRQFAYERMDFFNVELPVRMGAYLVNRDQPSFGWEEMVMRSHGGHGNLHDAYLHVHENVEDAW